VVPVESGSLAVSSPNPVDIYQGSRYLGSTPISMDLPAGTHVFEYRTGELRQTVTHVVKSNETTTAMITFDVVVQVNARPWAQVYVGGTERRSLGQTPLSDLKVPVGTALIFENPKFPPKIHRVTVKDTAIQVVFP
jgi:hypothetical protein